MIARMLASSRFPRAAALIEILALAELFRRTAASLDALAESSWRLEPTSLRAAAHGLARKAVAELDGQVST